MDPITPSKIFLSANSKSRLFKNSNEPTHMVFRPTFFDIHNEFDTKPTPFNVPSVSIYGLCLCHHLGFKNICFIGQDLG